MFEIRCVVPDKKLSDTLRALRVLAEEPPVVLPVDEEPSETAPRRKTKRVKGSAKEVIKAWLAEKNPETATAKEMATAVIESGLARASYFYGVQKLVEEGVLKKTATVGSYKVNRNG